MLGLGTFLKPSLGIAWLKNRIQNEYGKPVHSFLLRYIVEIEKFSFQIRSIEGGEVEKFGYKDERGILANTIINMVKKDVPENCTIDGFEFFYSPDDKSITIFYCDKSEEKPQYKSINVKL